MAHTNKGNLTGRAASTQKRDILEMIYSESDKSDQRIRAEWERTQEEAIQCCIALEGEEAFMAWYMDDRNIPPCGPITERIAILRGHLAALEFTKKYNMVDLLVGDECANIIKLEEIADSFKLEDANG